MYLIIFFDHISYIYAGTGTGVSDTWSQESINRLQSSRNGEFLLKDQIHTRW